MNTDFIIINQYGSIWTGRYWSHHLSDAHVYRTRKLVEAAFARQAKTWRNRFDTMQAKYMTIEDYKNLRGN